MIKKSIRKEIDKAIKNIWLHNICADYGNGCLIREASLQCSLYHHLQNAAIIELKYDSGNAISTSDYIKTDMPKLREYVRCLNYDCQYYFGVIYENECEWLHWFDKRNTNNWANGRLTELNAGYLGETMYFEVNSYNNMNFQQKRALCNVVF